jgi:hypothetical protein
MPGPTGDDGPSIPDDALDILAQVKLKSFSAAPTTIGPFGASVLSWKVDGPRGKFVTELANTAVPPTGSRPVQPRVTTSYGLSARVRSVRKGLGAVTVRVDLAACQNYALVSVQSFIEGILTTGVEQSPDNLYFIAPFGQPIGPTVTFEPGRIKFRLLVKQRLDNRPDPTITIDAGFGLGLDDGHFVPRGQDVDADVSVPWWVYAAPGAPIWLPILLSNGRQAARQAGTNAITSIVQALDQLYGAEDGYVRQNVEITDESGGTIEVTDCPSDTLQDLARLSEAAQAVE